jgi:hypothetical protein
MFKLNQRIKRIVIRLFAIKAIDIMDPYVPYGYDSVEFHRNVDQAREHFTSVDGESCTFCGSKKEQCHCW